MDILPQVLADYIAQGGKFDAKVHAYMHNLLTIAELNNKQETYSRILTDISVEIIPDYITDQGRKTLESMLDPAHFTGEYIIQYIKK